MNHNRRKVLTTQNNEIPDFDPETQFFARVLSCRSGDIFEVEYLNPSDGTDATEDKLITASVRMPSKFKHVIWAKTGDLVILSPEDAEFSSRTQLFIRAILAQHHTKSFMQQRQLPALFIPDKLAHKSYARHGTIQTTNTNERFLGASDEDEDDFLEEIDNRRARPFADSESSEDSD